MHRPPASRCYRAVHRQIVPAVDHVWITDSVLSQALERYCYVSKAVRRMASSVPGPLEARRRLGKRQMTELNAIQIHPSLPAWALSNAPDLTQWQWKPPSIPSMRPRGHPDGDIGRVPSVSLLPEWLINWGSKGWEATTTQDHDADTTLTDIEVARPPKDGVSQPFLEDLFAWQAALQSAPLEHVTAQFQELCDRLQQQLTLAALPTEKVKVAFDILWEGLHARFMGLEVEIRHHSLRLCSAVVVGTTSCKVLRPEDFGTSLWSSLLVYMSNLPASNKLCQLFERILKAFQQDFINTLQRPILAMLRTFSSWERESFDYACDAAISTNAKLSRSISEIEASVAAGDLEAALLTMKSTKHLCQRYSNRIWQAHKEFSDRYYIRRLATCLGPLDPGPHGQLLTDATEQLLDENDGSVQEQCERSQRWLFVLAHMPLVNQDFLFSTALRIQSAGFRMSTADLAQLLLHQWNSRGYLRNPEKRQRDFESHRSGRNDASLAALAVAIFEDHRPTLQIQGPQSRHCNRLGGSLAKTKMFRTRAPAKREQSHSEWVWASFISFWHCLRWLGRDSELVDSLKVIRGLTATYGVPLDFLEMLARTCRDVHIALRIHSLWIEIRGPDWPQWNPRFWETTFPVGLSGRKTTYTEKLSEALGKSLTAEEVYFGLEIGLRKSQFWEPPIGQHSRIGSETAALVVKLAVQFAHMSTSQPRQAYRRVTQCRRFLLRHGREVPPVMLQAIFHTITRDMVQGDHGRISRMRYFLGILRKQYNDQVALQCALALRALRDVNRRLRRKERTAANWTQKLR